MNDILGLLDVQLWSILEADTAFQSAIPVKNRIKVYARPNQEEKGLDRDKVDVPSAKIEFVPDAKVPTGTQPRTFGMTNYTALPVDMGVPFTVNARVVLTYQSEKLTADGDVAAIAERALWRMYPNIGLTWVDKFTIAHRRRWAPRIEKPDVGVRNVEATLILAIAVRPKLSLLTA